MPQKTEAENQNFQLGMRLLESDEDVIKDILRKFGPQICGFLWQKYDGVFNTADIEDVLAVAIFRLWQARENYDESKGSVRVWFFKIADNAAKDVLKLGWRQAKNLEVNPDLQEVEDFHFSETNTALVGIASKNEQDVKKLKDLSKIIKNLPDKERYIVMADARSPEGKADTGYLADELGIPTGTVRVYRKRAMDKIKEEFRKLGYQLP